MLLGTIFLFTTRKIIELKQQDMAMARIKVKAIFDL